VPPGTPLIVGKETAERFSFYGRAILVVFVARYRMNAAGEADAMNEEQARGCSHDFGSGSIE
jgi:POT family proton-dependent oligopeptide transporter